MGKCLRKSSFKKADPNWEKKYEKTGYQLCAQNQLPETAKSSRKEIGVRHKERREKNREPCSKIPGEKRGEKKSFRGGTGRIEFKRNRSTRQKSKTAAQTRGRGNLLAAVPKKKAVRVCKAQTPKPLSGAGPIIEGSRDRVETKVGDNTKEKIRGK